MCNREYTLRNVNPYDLLAVSNALKINQSRNIQDLNYPCRQERYVTEKSMKNGNRKGIIISKHDSKKQ